MSNFKDQPTENEMSRLLEIMARLRDPESGCPWDIEQTFATIAPHTIEEAYEVADAIEQEDWPHLQEELGDLLLQVVFHSQMAKDENLFNFNDVAKSISDKMVARHPHVFGDEEIATAEEQTIHWEQLKEKERQKKAEKQGVEPPSALDGVAGGLPSMTRALKLQKRAVRVGFDWPDVSGVFDKIREELNEVEEEVRAEVKNQENIKDEIGDLLFTVVNLARWADVDPDSALRACNHKFEKRFKEMEASLGALGKEIKSVDLTEMESHWIKAKKLEK